MSTAPHTSSRQSGLTLIELMVAMTIGLLLLGGAASLFISNKRIYREQEEMSRLQENGRFALELLIHDIRMTGYVGCHDEMGKVVNLVSTDPTVLTAYLSRVEGSEAAANWLPSGSTGDVASMVAGSDGITLRYLNPTIVRLATAMAPGALDADLDVAADSGADADVDMIIADNSLLAIADCATTDVFAAGNVDEDSIPHAATLSKAYGEDAQIMRLVARRYFIRNDANGDPGLWVTWNTGAAEELIQGVENMQILYGIDTGGDGVADTYLNAAAVNAATAWAAVASVRIALLLRTVDVNAHNEIDTRTYTLLNTNVGPFNDQRRRRVFTATVSIRNNT
jgi:type IV pilus assembly protein PilW